MLSPDEEVEETSEWLTTFADLSMLLLVFFILLYSLSDPDPGRFTTTFTSVTQALKHDKITTSRITQDEAAVLVDQVQMRRQIIEQQRKVFSDVKLLQTTKGVAGVITATFEEGVITLRAPGDVFFESGQVDLTAAGQRALLTMKDFFIQHPRQTINIKGFTDNVNPSGGRFRDNWEISALRAVNVLRFLMKMGIESKRLTATGLADLDPLVPNTTAENRAKNRRVEFVLERRIQK
ncbi:MAG: flagellar motor protein MotB [Proteobacteria bacterium]|nr:flagellar motor protein MotB [Pseudomonadota bacterium]MBU1611365.1 flagellar motor protein MotB [Pseudomonadota bacterium]